LKKKWTGQDHISLEIVAKNNLIFFYVGCPRKISEIVIKNLHAQYPHAEIVLDDQYSIFPQKPLKIAISLLGLKKPFMFPIKTYRQLEEDPLNAITNSLSKLSEDESAGIQFLFAAS
jgi:hypothetical protein